MNKIYQRLKIVVTVLLFCVAPSILFGQTKISGTVTDDKHLPLPGVSVRIKEQNKGTVTDIDGRYIINASAGQTLVFSFYWLYLAIRCSS
ncbi:carboxypeptidase-like regulatory domain-containing protein [Mucilaginibacter sp. UC70_90]